MLYPTLLQDCILLEIITHRSNFSDKVIPYYKWTLSSFISTSSQLMMSNDSLRNFLTFFAPWIWVFKKEMRWANVEKGIWRNKTLLKAAFFAWTISLDKIITMDNLQKHRLITVDWYCIWKHNGKSMDHLLLCCDNASEIWYFL